MGSAFHQLCPRYSGTLTPTAPTAIRLWDAFTFYLLKQLFSYCHLLCLKCFKFGTSLLFFWSTFYKTGLRLANSADPDQTAA